ncbi:MAG: isopentenyl-diphosphate delta-isomerase, partial [Gammaproteobacteria bacterium]
VYIGYSEDKVRANENEIAAWRFIDPDALDAETSADPSRFTPWFKLEWDRLRKDFDQELTRN